MRWGFGLHLANGPADHGNAIDAIGNGSFTLLHYQADLLPEIRRKAPEALALIRYYLPNWAATDPRDGAKECAGFYRAHRQWTRHATWANEQNLADESGGMIGATPQRRATRATYIAIHDWNMRWLDQFNHEPGTDDALLHYPALATGHSDDQDDDGFIGLEICRASIDRCQILDRHFYPSLDHPLQDKWYGAARVQLTEELFPGKPLFISECGNFRVGDPRTPEHYTSMGYYWQGRPSVLGWTYFIAEDPTKDHQLNDMSRQPEILDALRKTVRTPKPGDELFTALVVQPSVVQPVVVQPSEPFAIGPGFADLLLNYPRMAGEAVASEVWHRVGSDEVSIMTTTNGTAIWIKKENRRVFIPRGGTTVWDDENGGAFKRKVAP